MTSRSVRDPIAVKLRMHIVDILSFVHTFFNIIAIKAEQGDVPRWPCSAEAATRRRSGGQGVDLHEFILFYVFTLYPYNLLILNIC